MDRAYKTYRGCGVKSKSKKYKMKVSFEEETMSHVNEVRESVFKFGVELEKRAILHDKSKFHKPELNIFNEYTPKLKEITYGSEEYKQCLKEMKPALEHHYKVNRHHPEHFENGIRGMNLVDIVEMFCDWYAASKRHADGDIKKSIEINQNRFGYSDDLKNIFENTIGVLKNE